MITLIAFVVVFGTAAAVVSAAQAARKVLVAQPQRAPATRSA